MSQFLIHTVDTFVSVYGRCLSFIVYGLYVYGLFVQINPIKIKEITFKRKLWYSQTKIIKPTFHLSLAHLLFNKKKQLLIM